MLSRILSKFKKVEKENIAPSHIFNKEGWFIPKKADELLNTPLRQQYLTTIWQNVSMSPEMFKHYYRELIERYAEMVQLLPASESHHHSHVGGMLDHGLEVISIATKLRQNYVLPQNAAPEEQAKQRDVWTAAIIYGALLHDIGKVAVDLEVIQKNGERWYPWNGIPTQPYKFRYIKDRDYALHPAIGGFFANYLIPNVAFDWLATYQQAFSSLMYTITGHHDRAGILTEIIQKADQISVTLALGGDPNKLSEQPKVSFAKQLHIALRYVVNHFKLNAPKGGSDGWLTEEGLWLMSKSTADNIRAHLLSQGISVPSQNGKLFDELQAHHLIQKTQSGTAIWNGQVVSNAGWVPAKPFTLLKIDPNIVWDSIDKRPDLFEGRVTVVGEEGAKSEGNSIPISSDMSISSSLNTPVITENIPENQISEAERQTDVINDKKVETAGVSDMDFTLNLFSQIEPEHKDEAKFVPEFDTSITETVKTASSIVQETIHVEQQPEQSKRSKQAKPNNLSTPSAISSKDVSDVMDGKKFIDWIKAGVIAEKLSWNRPNAKLHIVENHLFLVTPSIFQLYLREVAGSTDQASWELLQKHFQNLGIHKRQHMEDDSRNIWECKVIGPNKHSFLNGYLIEDTRLFFGDKILLNNQWLKLQGELV
ncbi:MobH family relaxase [Avibacterium sp. 21-599]|uniref:MobH family relaxase n=1 Tax=Avibacterium sp. 21-599 TaxID=2911528 RepID=UPI002247C5E1|nr:MobH family relaxase [Avibacterium sp. 21-599]MCW9718513.1 TraI domain-containing protein [Avibacterium sp. 21-599]